jgi:DNA-binding response OmpR family regulator
MKRILIVEHNHMLANLFRSTLVGAGYAVEVCGDGQAGLAAAQATHPDVILLDLTVPRKPGLEVLLAVRADERLADVPVVLLLANGYTPDRLQELWDAGATQVLMKAESTPKGLMDAVRASLGPTP